MRRSIAEVDGPGKVAIPSGVAMSRLHRPITALLALAFFLFGAASLARAQTDDPDRLIDRGIQARARGRDAEALELFERAHRIRPTALSLAQLALAEQALGRWLEADEHLRAAMASGDRWVVRNRATLDEAMSAIAQHVGSLVVEGTPAGATVTLAERQIGTLPMSAPARVLVGRARLSVRADGHEPVQREIDVRPGETLRETVTLAPTAASAPPPPAPEPPPPERTPARPRSGGSPLTTLGIVGLGVGGAAVVGGTVALVLREGHASDWNSDACLQGGRTRSENCQADLDAGETAELFDILGFAVGGAVLAGSVVLLIVGASGDDDAEPAPQSARVIGCSVGPGDVGLSCAGRF